MILSKIPWKMSIFWVAMGQNCTVFTMVYVSNPSDNCDALQRLGEQEGRQKHATPILSGAN